MKTSLILITLLILASGLAFLGVKYGWGEYAVGAALGIFVVGGTIYVVYRSYPR